MDASEAERILYEVGTDGVCEFQGGTSIRINRAMLAMQSSFFRKEFFGSSPKTNVKITDFDRDTFKTFLDCLFGVKKYTILDSLLIYPIAHQYDVKESLYKCNAVLEPKEMSENVCVILNLALFYKRDNIVAKVIKFINRQCGGVVSLLENEKFRNLLEPMTVSKLIEDTELNSFAVELIYEWGKDYLKEHRKSIDVDRFLKENEISSKIRISDFESSESAFNFFKLKNGTIVGDEVFKGLEMRITDPSEKFPKRSEWFKIDGEFITEIVEFSHYFTAWHHVYLQIFSNKVLTYMTQLYMDVTVQYEFRTILSSVIKRKAEYCEYGGCSCTSTFNISGFCWSSPVKSRESSLFTLSPNGSINSIIIGVAPNRCMEIKSVRITYKFNDPSRCKILKTSLGDKFRNPDGLYFTKNVVIA